MAAGADPRPADVALWAAEQARLLREGRLGEIDCQGLAAEIAAVGRRPGELLDERLAALATRLLMWKYLPGARLPSWRTDIAAERRAILRLLAASPSLAGRPAAAFADAYRAGRLRAAAETGIDVGLMPEAAPFTLAEARDEAFLPVEPGIEAYREAARWIDDYVEDHHV